MNGAIEREAEGPFIVVAHQGRLLVLRTSTLQEISRSILLLGAAIIALTARQKSEVPPGKMPDGRS